MPTRMFGIAMLCLFLGQASLRASEKVPLHDATGPWLALLRSDNATLRATATQALADLTRKHPTVANDLIRTMASETNMDLVNEHALRLVPLAKDSPATVSTLIRLIRERGSDYRLRNFCVKVLSQAGAAAATRELVDSFTETYCPVPGAYLRVLRALGKDSLPVLAYGFRHADANVRKWSTTTLRILGRTDPASLQLLERLQKEPPLVQQLREGMPPDRIVAVLALADLARTTPGTATLLIQGLKDERDPTVLAEAQTSLSTLGREVPEVVTALMAAVRSEDQYRLRNLAVKVLPKVGANLNTREVIEALGDHECPVPSAMRRILLAAGPDAISVLTVAMNHSNPEIRTAATSILQRIPRTVASE